MECNSDNKINPVQINVSSDRISLTRSHRSLIELKIDPLFGDDMQMSNGGPEAKISQSQGFISESTPADWSKYSSPMQQDRGGLKIEWKSTVSTLEIHSKMEDDVMQIFDLQIHSEKLKSFSVLVDLSSSCWYGGSEMAAQCWPLGRWPVPTTPFVTCDIYRSSGIAVTISDSSPLWVGFHDSVMELKSSRQCRYYDRKTASENYPCLKMRIWVPRVRLTLRRLHLEMIKRHFSKPTDVPDREMFRFQAPIWSTWARFKKDISDEKLRRFAEEIRGSELGGCQIEMDDGWATAEGDLVMDPVKFPDPHALITALSNMGFRVTFWVHPFFNADSETARDVGNHSYMLSHPSGSPALWSSWWNGEGLMLDATSPSAKSWFISRLRHFQMTHSIYSFKFDAGEANWVPSGFEFCSGHDSVRDPIPFETRFRAGPDSVRDPVPFETQFRSGPDSVRDPNEITRGYAEMAASFGGGAEVRVGHRTQHLPIIVRVMDKDSKWGHDNGLRSLIPSVLTIGILGYPFVLPDMVGGNAYDGSSSCSAELFIRWIEVTALMPAIQYSLAPWDYADLEVLRIAQKMKDLRRRFQPIIEELAEEATQNGSPIIRPMWWLDESSSGLLCDSQFLLGDDILVAPVLEEGATSRLVLFPPGNWIPFDLHADWMKSKIEPIIEDLTLSELDADWMKSKIEPIIGPTVIPVFAPLDHLPVYVRQTAAFQLRSVTG